jgi:hypothetical protein
VSELSQASSSLWRAGVGGVRGGWGQPTSQCVTVTSFSGAIVVLLLGKYGNRHPVLCQSCMSGRQRMPGAHTHTCDTHWHHNIPMMRGHLSP